MKFTIETGTLQGLLSAARATIGRASTIPVLTYIRLEALAAGKIELRATDLDKELTLSGAAQVSAPGVILAEHAPLADWVKTLAEGSQIEIEATETGLVARCGRARHRVPALPESDFPASPEMIDPIRFEMASSDLARMLRLTLPAVSSEETAYYLCGVHLVRRGDYLRAEATNKHLLSIVGCRLPPDAEAMPAMILPTLGARAILGLIDGTGTLRIGASENRLLVETEHWRFASKLIEGDYPDMPQMEARVAPNRSVEIGGAALAAAVRRVTVAAELVEKRVRAVRIEFTAAEVRVSAGTTGVNESEDSVDAQLTGDPVSMAFNSAYLRDLLDTHKFDRLVVGIEDAVKPILLREQGAPPCDCAILMPRLG